MTPEPVGYRALGNTIERMEQRIIRLHQGYARRLALANDRTAATQADLAAAEQTIAKLTAELQTARDTARREVLDRIPHWPYDTRAGRYCGKPHGNGLVLDGCGEPWPCATVRRRNQAAENQAEKEGE